MVKLSLVRKLVQHRSHPPREALYLPDSAQASLRIRIQQIPPPRFVELFNRPSQHSYIGHRQIQSLRARRRHDVRRISRQKQTPVPHGLDHKAAHARHPFLQHRPRCQLPAITRETSFQFMPNLFVRPLLDVLIRLALNVQAADLRRSHAEKGEAALMGAINQLVRRRRRLRQNAKPPERILSLKNCQRARRQARPANSVEAIASRDEITAYLVPSAVFLIRNPGRVPVEIMHADIIHLKQHLPSTRQSRVGQVLHHLVLGIDRDSLPARQVREIDPMSSPVEAQLDPLMNEPLALQAFPNTRFDQQINRALLQYTRPYPFFDVLPAAVLDDDVIDSLEIQKMR